MGESTMNLPQIESYRILKGFAAFLLS